MAEYFLERANERHCRQVLAFGAHAEEQFAELVCRSARRPRIATIRTNAPNVI